MTSSAEPMAGFASTQWSVVAAAQSRHTVAGAAAMATLCSRYWRPLYGYVRRRGFSREDAQDLTQAYFLRLLEKNFLDLSLTSLKFSPSGTALASGAEDGSLRMWSIADIQSQLSVLGLGFWNGLRRSRQTTKNDGLPYGPRPGRIDSA